MTIVAPEEQAVPDSKKQRREPRIVDIGLERMRNYPNEPQHSRQYAAHIHQNGEWALDTEDPPRNMRVIGDRWDRYDRRIPQRIIARVYVLPRDVEEWRQIVLARDVDQSPHGRLNWTRIQDDYSERFRGILENPTRIHYIIVCTHDGVTNINDYD